uniref:Potassium channel domain-containing protein n=1 Tax=Cannabis sativa TaxID=3483 RepID=A0A803Q7F0_CANSA
MEASANRTNKEELGKIVVLCWAIWSARNDLIWHQRVRTVRDVVVFANSSLNQFLKAQGRENIPSLSPLKAGDGSERWIKPVSGIKLNVDAATFDRDSKHGYGCVVRNSHGALISVFAGCYNGKVTAELAEIMGIKEALSWLKRNSNTQAIIESDSLVCVEAIRSAEKIASGFGFIVDECKNMLKSVGTIFFYVVRNQLDGKKTDGVLDAVYFCIVTMTTVGYGDLVPSSNAAKLLACAFVFTGMALVGLTLSKAADYLVEKQETLLVKTLNMRRKDQAEVLKEAQTNRTKYKCILVFIALLVLMTCGTIFLITVEKLAPVDAFYCVCSTITTLGYGDKSFSTKGGRVFAIFWILISTICLAQFFLYIAELFTESRQRALVHLVLTRRMTNVDLEAADLDDDGIVGAAEFVIYKLKEMGKISQDDVSQIMEEFDELDVDQSGTLSACDINLAQSSPPHHTNNN